MKLLNKVEQIIIHCSASDKERDDSIQAIRDLHTASKLSLVKWGGKLVYGKEFDEVGYQWVITQDGELHKGREEKYQGAHCYGQNHNSIGICLTGNKIFSLAQYRTLFRLLDHLKMKYRLEDKDIFGHYEYSDKTCPNFEVRL